MQEKSNKKENNNIYFYIFIFFSLLIAYYYYRVKQVSNFDFNEITKKILNREIKPIIKQTG